MPDRSSKLEKENCKGGKKSKDTLSILFCVNSTTGEEKIEAFCNRHCISF